MPIQCFPLFNAYLLSELNYNKSPIKIIIINTKSTPMMTQKKQYILTDSSNYMIEEVFGINDQVLMLNSQISSMAALINLPLVDEHVQDAF